MLTISKPLSASQARTYHEREFASEKQTTGAATSKATANGRASLRTDGTLPGLWNRNILRG